VCPKELSLLHKAEVLLGMKPGEKQVEKTKTACSVGSAYLCLSVSPESASLAQP
jgi:hypothetical protein